jgi:hypothetical protein
MAGKQTQGDSHVQNIKIFIIGALLSGGVYAADAKKATKEMCQEAVTQGLDTVGTMKRTVEKNFAGGYMTQAEYDKTIRGLNDFDGLITMDNCMASNGVDLKLFVCLSKNYGDIVGCTQKLAVKR